MHELPPPEAADSDDPKEMSLIGHLDELRTRLLKCIAGLLAAFLIGFFLSDPVTEFLIRPIRATAAEPGHEQQIEVHVRPDGTLQLPRGLPTDPKLFASKHFVLVSDANPQQRFQLGEPAQQQIYYHNPVDPFMVKIKVGFLLAIVVTSPMLLFQLWRFMRPGLTVKERKVVKPMLGFGLILFPIGAIFAYYLVAFLLRVMQHYAPAGLSPMLEIFTYFSLLLTLMVVSGVIFELPLALAIAARVGLVTPGQLVQYRRQAYAILAVVASCFAPPDAYSMILMFVVLLGLFEISIAVCRPMAALHRRDQEELQQTLSNLEMNNG